MPQVINVTGIGELTFPDGMTDQQMSDAIQKEFGANKAPAPDMKKTNAGGNILKSLIDLTSNAVVGLPVSAFLPDEKINEVGGNALVGLGRGFVDAGQGIKQNLMKVNEAIGIEKPGATEAYTQQVDKERAFYDKTPAADSIAGGVGRFAGNVAPYVAAPVSGAGGLLARMGANAAIGSGIGALQYTPEGSSQAFNVGLGGLLGASFPLAGAAVGQVGKAVNFVGKHLGNKNAVAREVLDGVDVEQTKDVLEAARRLDPDWQLTPAEASGNPLIGGKQGRLGASNETAQALLNAGNESTAHQKNIIGDLLETIAPGGKKAQQAKAKVYYDKAGDVIIPPEKMRELLDDEVIKHAYANVANRPEFAQQLKDIPPNSLKYLDYVKKYINNETNKQVRKGADESVKFIKESQDKLVKTLDELSPYYKQGRDEARRGIIRGNIEKRMGKLKGDNNGSKFYRTFLEKDSDFNKLVADTKDMPGATQKLLDMRKTFKNLIAPVTAKTAARLARSSLDVPRSSVEAVKDIIGEFLGGKYDKAAVDLILSRTWDKELRAVNKIKDRKEKANAMVSLLSRVSTIAATDAVNDATKKEAN